jgi:hypothetical protein
MQMFLLIKFYILLKDSYFQKVVSVEVKNPTHVRQNISGINQSALLLSLNFNSFDMKSARG